jgi:AcrR family transcriptional regulator
MNDQQNSTESTRGLRPHQAEVIAALMHGATVTDAAERANVDRTTFYLWLRSDSKFQAELDRARQEQTDAMRARLRGLAAMAVSTLEEMLTDMNVPPGVRLKAALAILQGTDTLDDLGRRLLVHSDPAVHVDVSSAAEELARRIARLAERSSEKGLSCNGSVE